MNKNENSSEKVSGDQNEPPFSLHQADIDNINAFAARQAAAEKVSAPETRKHTMDCLSKGDASACPICKPINDAAFQRDRDELHKEQDQLLESEVSANQNRAIHQTTARTVGKQLLAVATTKEQKAIALYWTGVCMDDLRKNGLTLEEYLKFNKGNFKNQEVA